MKHKAYLLKYNEMNLSKFSALRMGLQNGKKKRTHKIVTA